MLPRSSLRTASADTLRPTAAPWLCAAVAFGIAAALGGRAQAGVQHAAGLPSGQPWNLLASGTQSELEDSREGRLAELSDQEYSSYSGVGALICTVNGQKQTSTAFLVGSFDLAVTVAHTFAFGGTQATPSDCIYTSTDSMGQIRERLPVAYYKSQWVDANARGVPAKDLAVVRLAQRSAFAHRTLPLGKFNGSATPVTMIGFTSEMDTDTFKRKSRGTVYERDTGSKRTRTQVADIFTHDMDSRGLASGAPVLDERSGVIIGVHTRLMPSTLQATAEHTPVAPAPTARNALITMSPWLESTLRAEIALTLEAEAAH